MKTCPGCQREVADDATACECGMRFAENAAEAAPGGDVQTDAPSDPQPNGEQHNNHNEADLHEADLDDVDLDEVDLDEVDLDTEEIDLAEADLDMDSTEEYAFGHAAAEAEFPSYSRREQPTPKKTGAMVVIIGAHAVIILAAMCIFYQKSKQRSGGGDYDPDRVTAATQDYVTKPNSAARMVESAVRQLGLPCPIIEIVKESPASPEARVILQKTNYKSVQQLRDLAELAAVQVANRIFRLDDRLRDVYVEIRAPLDGRQSFTPAIAVDFNRAKVNGSTRGLSPRQLLKLFGAKYHPKLTQAQ